MSVVVLTVLTAIYAVAILTFAVGIIRTHRHKGTATPYVSVVIPMRNEEEFLRRTLDALAAQEYTGQYEIICVDDRSTDSTGKILDDFVATHGDKF
ncbi:MAG: glycosyltransferase family 2 protein, partial [Fibrobacter sp.]|nr:glycosyltransferase family 2 protein [Fibrobacter sp.]